MPLTITYMPFQVFLYIYLFVCALWSGCRPVNPWPRLLRNISQRALLLRCAPTASSIALLRLGSLMHRNRLSVCGTGRVVMCRLEVVECQAHSRVAADTAATTFCM